jgi:hypothetical protein
MKSMRRLALLSTVLVATILGAATPALASPVNIGWVYTTNRGGAAYFDADLNGYPSFEKITVCDNMSNGRGVRVYVNYYNAENTVDSVVVSDPSNDGHCESVQGNFFIEEQRIYLMVYEYAGSDEYINWESGYGVA